MIALQLPEKHPYPEPHASWVAIAESPLRAKYVVKSEQESYARKANRISIRHRNGRVIAVLEIVSPGNKDREIRFREFVTQSVSLIEQGVHVLIVDLFPPPLGILAESTKRSGIK